MLEEDDDKIPLIEYEYGKDGKHTLVAHSGLEASRYLPYHLTKEVFIWPWGHTKTSLVKNGCKDSEISQIIRTFANKNVKGEGNMKTIITPWRNHPEYNCLENGIPALIIYLANDDARLAYQKPKVKL